MLADDADERLRGAGEATVATVDEAKFTPEVHAFNGKQLHFSGLHIILCKALADKRNASIGSDKALDHTDAGQLHGDVNASAIRPEKLVEHLASEAGARKNERLLGDFSKSDLGAMRERVLGANHEAEAIFVDVVHLQIGRLDGQGNDAHIDRAIFDALQNLVAEVAINADVHERIAALKLRKNVRKKIEAGRFVSAEDDGALNDVAAISDNLDGFVAQAKQLFSVLEKNFAGGSQLDGLGGAVEKPGFISLFELANLGADSGLRAENFLARA